MANQPKIIEGYKIIKEIGAGGFGNVYLVEKGGKEFALKKLTTGNFNPEISQRFIREALKMEELRKKYHLDYLVEVEEVLFDDLAFVMQYIPLGSTQYFAQQKDLEFVHSFIQSIYQLHQIGVVHRDLKPANLRVLDSRPVLIDFGVASWWDTNSNILPVGTKYYSPPEVVCLFGEYKKLDAARNANKQLIEILPQNAKERIKYIKKLHDIYSLGITVGELLTGSIPLSKDNYVEYLHTGDHPAYRGWLEKIPSEFREFVTAATSFFPLERPQLDKLSGLLSMDIPDRIIDDYNSEEIPYFEESDYECLSCGKKTAPPANFCAYCGAELEILALHITPNQEILTDLLPSSVRVSLPGQRNWPLTVAISLRGEDFEIKIGRNYEGVQLSFMDDNWMSGTHGRLIKDGRTLHYIDGVDEKLPTNPGRINNIPIGDSKIELLAGTFLLLGSTVFDIKKYFGDFKSL